MKKSVTKSKKPEAWEIAYEKSHVFYGWGYSDKQDVAASAFEAGYKAALCPVKEKIVKTSIKFHRLTVGDLKDKDDIGLLSYAAAKEMQKAIIALLGK